MNVGVCADQAKALGFKYVGVQAGNECYASNSLAYAVSLGVSTACTTTCANDTSSTCGGGCANAIYQVRAVRCWALLVLLVGTLPSSTWVGIQSLLRS